MGSFYVNFSVRTADQGRTVDVLRRAGRVALVTPPQAGYVVVYDEEADTQATDPILSVGALLSRELNAPVLAVLNHDDDIFCYWLFADGRQTDSYNSDPDYFGEAGDETEQGGDVHSLCAALRPDAEPAAVEAILRGEAVFAVERHEQLAEALGLPDWSVGYGYNYASDGELADEIESGELVRTG